MAERPSGRASKRSAIGEPLELENKRFRHALDESATELVCPITHALPLDPVTAEDGHFYEREAIEQWLLQGNGTSPVTHENMGHRLTPAVQVRNMIEHMVRSGAVSGDKAGDWTKRIKDIDKVKELRLEAEQGNVNAMQQLGLAYCHGQMGIIKDRAQALQFFRQAADKGDVISMSMMGDLSTHAAVKVHWYTRAAEGGEQRACFLLGRAFMREEIGLPKDPHLARIWLLKVQGCIIKPRSRDKIDTQTVALLQQLDLQ
mmetsp:Transcript_127380/g.271569  ORF Transcript_127380/g.271569 Transcript_127380/m.271569 type:complete len:259 (-) Transcript_127380:97-873(-)